MSDVVVGQKGGLVVGTEIKDDVRGIVCRC